MATLAEKENVAALSSCLRTDIAAFEVELDRPHDLYSLASACRSVHDLDDDQHSAIGPSWSTGCHGYVVRLIPGPASRGVATARKYASLDLGFGMSGSGSALQHVLGAPNPQIPGDTGVAQAVMSSISRLRVVAVKIRELVWRAAGLDPAWLTRNSRSDECQARFLRYPASNGGIGVGSHTDYELLTFVASDHPGLEVLDLSGSWRTASDDPSKLTVLIGDTLEALTGGQIESALHRVRLGPVERFSSVLFSCVRYDTQIAPRGADGSTEAHHHFSFGPRLAGYMVRNTPYLLEKFSLSNELRPQIGPASNPFKEAKVARAAEGQA